MKMQFAVSSWSVHGLLGTARFAQQGNKTVLSAGQSQGDVSLLQLPAMIAEAGIHTLEICHFHFPSIEESYLDELKQVLNENGVTLENILIDAGNIANPNGEERQADIEMAKQWQEITAYLGGKGNRIDCGRERPSPETITHTVNALKELTTNADRLGIKVVTENFHQMSREPDTLIDIMQKVEHPIGLCVDFGNAEASADKFGTIEKLMPYATSIHCKANYHDNAIDDADLNRSLSYLKQANFQGPITLIINETENEWEEMMRLKTAVSNQLT